MPAIILIAGILISIARMADALKSAAIYMYQLRTREFVPTWIKRRFIEGDGSANTGLHFTENIFWYSMFGSFSLLLFAAIRQSHSQISAIGLSLAITMLCSSMAWSARQWLINISTQAEEEETKEWFFGVRLWRVTSQRLRITGSVLSFIACIYLIFFIL